MKLLAGLIFSVMLLSAADPQAKTEQTPSPKATPKAKAKQQSKTVPPAKGEPQPAAAEAPRKGNEIPKGAVQTADGMWHYTDAQGKKWIYHKTPFGVMSGEEAPLGLKSLQTESKRFDDVTATEDGDIIHFERPGSFGVYKWSKKKTELDEMEQAVWDRQRARSAGKQD